MTKQTTLAEIGEFGLIERITKQSTKIHKTTGYGIGDDCAVLKYTDTLYTLISTDLLVEGIHFDLVYTPIKHLGYKAVICNISDIYAMNGTPQQITVSIAVSAKFSVEAIEQLYEGIHTACKAYNIDLIGGDTTSSITGLTISITAIGIVAESDISYRKTARVNDLICVTGNLGAAYMGLQILQREKSIFKEVGAQPKLEGYEYVLQRQLKPESPKHIIEQLKKNGIIPTAMIDISDGLSSELFHICKQSHVGCNIYEEKIPIHENTADVCKEFSIEPLIPALHGGDDYELLFTIPITCFDSISTIQGVTVIGNITEADKGLYLISKAGDKVALKAQGWTSFTQ
ncbi:MAG TPA: thiamine-phosphate kinase [Bacteroidales bacterium]|jgi:thiamine-monophosphate kinase|nr:thiamine-phosphate kinase [Bacteroidales bacterium]HRS18885.1 thiamine-phosphate kinase [Bacteroidales bacterium]